METNNTFFGTEISEENIIDTEGKVAETPLPFSDEAEATETDNTVTPEVVETTELSEVDITAKDITVGSVNWNYKEIKAQAQAISEYCTSQEITDDNVSEFKKMDKQLGSCVQKLKASKKIVKDTLTAPIKQFDNETKDVMEIFQNAQEVIKAKYAPYNEAKLKEKTEKVEKYKEKQLKTVGLRPEYAEKVIVSGVMLSSKLKDDKAKVDAQIEALVAEQTFHDALLAKIEATVEAGNNTVSQKVEEAEINSWLTNGMSQYNSANSEELNNALINSVISGINSFFENLRKNEEKIREEAIAREREKAAEAARAQELAAMQAAPIYPENDGFQAVPEVTQTVVEQVNITPQPVQPVGVLSMPNEFDDYAPIETPPVAPAASVTPSDDRMFHYNVSLEGKYSSLVACGDEFLALCAKYGITFKAENGYYLNSENVG